MAIKIKQVINFQECAKKIQTLLPEFDLEDIESVFTNYFWMSQYCNDIVYNQEQVDDFISNCIVEFVAEQQNETKFCVKQALELQMPIGISNASDYQAGVWL